MSGQLSEAIPLGLQFPVADLKPEGRPFEGSLSTEELNSLVADFAGEFGYRLSGEARAEGQLYCTDAGEVIVSGTLKMQLEFSCVSCLKRGLLPLSLRGDYVMSKTKPGGEGEELSLDEAPEVYPFEGETVDLEPMLRESVLLSLSQHPRCELAGPSCPPRNYADKEGSNEPAVDPRWAPLLALKASLSASEEETSPTAVAGSEEPEEPSG